MRYFFAILSLIIAGVLIFFGIGQRTFLAGPNSIQHTVEPTAIDEHYAVIPAEIFDEVPGNPSVILTGENVFLATAEMRDVVGWLAPFTYDLVEVQENEQLLTSQHMPVRPDEDTADSVDVDSAETAESEEEQALPPLDPRGSDLWLGEYEGETTLKVGVALEPTQAVLITSGQDLTLPTEVKVSWAQERNTPLAGPLLASGALFAAFGGILYIFALDHDRRGLGPRRGRRGPLQGLRNRRTRLKNTSAKKTTTPSGRGSKLGFAVAGSIALALGVSACSPSYWPQTGTESDVKETAPATDDKAAVVPVKDAQIDKILERIVSVADEADSSLDAELLEPRFTGPALLQREKNYQIRGEEPSWRVLPRLTADRLDYDLVQSTEKWPRTMFVTVESSDSTVEEREEKEVDTEVEESADLADPDEQELTPSLSLLMTQESPHDNFQISRIIELRGGIEMPSAAPSAEGTAVLSDDIKTLRLPPTEVGDAFAQVLEEGVESEAAADFDLADEMLVQKMGTAWAQEQCIEGLECSVSVVKNDDPIVTLSTGQGGALVFATLLDSHTMKVEGERNVVNLSKVERALGLEGSHQRVVRQWQHDVLFYVPSANSGESIQILGSSSEIIQVTS